MARKFVWKIHRVHLHSDYTYSNPFSRTIASFASKYWFMHLMCPARPYMPDKLLIEICAYEHHVPYAWVLYTNIDMYMFWFSYDLCVGTLSLDVPVSLIHWLGPPPHAPVSCSLDYVLPRYPVPRPWSCLIKCIYIMLVLVTSCIREQHTECALITLVMKDLAFVWLPFCQFMFLVTLHVLYYICALNK